MWEPPRTYHPGPAPTHEDWNTLVQQVARLSRMTGTGLNTGVGFFPDQSDDGGGSPVQFVKMLDPLFPGTYDLPGIGDGNLMVPASGNRLSKTSSVVSVVNYSTSIYAPIDGLVVVTRSSSGKYVALQSSG